MSKRQRPNSTLEGVLDHLSRVNGFICNNILFKQNFVFIQFNSLYILHCTLVIVKLLSKYVKNRTVKKRSSLGKDSYSNWLDKT